jgi:hypothetical protein
MEIEIFVYWPLKVDISWFIGVCRQLYVLQDWREWGFAFWVISVETGKGLGFSSVIIELFLVIQKNRRRRLTERKLTCSVLRLDKNLSRKSETLKDLKLCNWGKILGNEDLSQLSSLYGILIEKRGEYFG